MTVDDTGKSLELKKVVLTLYYTLCNARVHISTKTHQVLQELSMMLGFLLKLLVSDLPINMDMPMDI